MKNEEICHMKFNTKTIHAGIHPDKATGAIMTPIYQTSTYVQEKIGEHKKYAYSRTANPTRDALEKNLAALENGKYGLCFSSGMASIDAIIKLLSPEDEVIASNDLYGGTYRIFKQVFEKYGIKFHFVNMQNADNIKNFINSKTRLIWAETPTNPTLSIIDIKALGKIAKQHKILFGIDNTFASPYLQNPLDLGADIVMHSATKFLGGHSDIVMGVLVVNNEKIAKDLYFIQNSCGAIASPMESFLVLRGIKTLHLRMQRHSENAAEIAHLLKKHPLIEKVYWPGFKEHPNHEIAKKQMRGFGGMLSFTLKGNSLEKAKYFAENTRIFTLAESLGGVESLIGHPSTMTHAAIPKEEREKAGVVDSLIRISVGIEDIEDLKNDLSNTLNQL